MSREQYMNLAFKIAKKGLNNTGSNPMVGAVIVKRGKIIGKGYHEKFGGPHAEVNAIMDAESKGHSVKNSLLFVTLEPCSHTKKQTPPCTKLILNKGIKKVFVGMKDPNEKVNGAGIRYLERHNVKTSILNYKEENKELNKGFINLIKTKRPYMTLKICLSLDGKIYNLNRPKDTIGDRTQLNHANKLRKDFDGIMVGVNTILNDNPRLTYRGPKDKSYTQPRPIVLDSKLRTPLKSKIILEKNKPIIFTQKSTNSIKMKTMVESGCEIIIMKTMTPQAILKKLGSLNLQRILVEGGAKVFSSFLSSRLWNELIVYYSPKFIGKHGLPLTKELSKDFLIDSRYKTKTKKVGRSLMLKIN
tara:strand:- start:800 stop:1876 length:1077 start_codon:yes stop_codon:yes gene_type:complete